MATWPAGIIINRKNYKEKAPDRVIRSNMAVGPDKLRRRSSAAVRELDLTLTLTDALLDTFDDFYLANDSIAFNFTDPRTSAAVEARFASVPEYSYRETIWDVSVKLEILP